MCLKVRTSVPLSSLDEAYATQSYHKRDVALDVSQSTEDFQDCATWFVAAKAAANPGVPVACL